MVTPSQPDSQALSRPCPWCQAATDCPCVVIVNGVRRTISRVHLARRLPEGEPGLYPIRAIADAPIRSSLALGSTLTMTGIRYADEPEDFLEDVMAYRPVMELPVSSLLTQSSPGTSTTMAKTEVTDKLLLAYIRKHPDQRHEQIAAGLGLKTVDTGPVLRALVATRKVKSTGDRRATRYAIAK